MENNDYNLELARYIWSILKTQITIFMSWGVNPESMKVIEGGLEFECNGFKHIGKVQIVLDEGKDLFEVHLISEKGENDADIHETNQCYQPMRSTVPNGKIKRSDNGSNPSI